MKPQHLIFALLVAGCGSTATSDTRVATYCKDSCAKALSCGMVTADQLADCEKGCNDQAAMDGIAQCKNLDTTISCTKDCESMSCGTWEQCAHACPNPC
jgi:hypothetical protein